MEVAKLVDHGFDLSFGPNRNNANYAKSGIMYFRVSVLLFFLIKPEITLSQDFSGVYSEYVHYVGKSGDSGEPAIDSFLVNRLWLNPDSSFEYRNNDLLLTCYSHGTWRQVEGGVQLNSTYSMNSINPTTKFKSDPDQDGIMTYIYSGNDTLIPCSEFVKVWEPESPEKFCYVLVSELCENISDESDSLILEIPFPYTSREVTVDISDREPNENIIIIALPIPHFRSYIFFEGDFFELSDNKIFISFNQGNNPQKRMELILYKE